MIDKKKEITQKQKNCGSQEMPETVCDKRCKICSSPHLKAIHDLKKAGHSFDRIVEIVRDKFGAEISSPSLSRHFQAYQKHKNIISAKLIQDDLIEEATNQASHTKLMTAIVNKMLPMIINKLDAGTLRIDMAELEKAMRILYQTLQGQGGDENDVLAIFQKATDKYGLNLQQGVLFKPAHFTGQRAD